MREHGGGLVVVSSGFHKTHVTTAAGEISHRGLLGLAITGAYPTRRIKRLLRSLGLADKGRVARLLERGEAIPEAKLRPLWLPEVLDELARAIARIPWLGLLYHRVAVATWRLYGRLAARKLRDAGDAGIYQYRAGFGARSIERARELGMVALCDHSIAHPVVLEHLVENRGEMPRVEGSGSAQKQLRPNDPVERRILDDIDAADAVLVNSEFVKETFLAVGWPADRIHVAYLGVDDNFVGTHAAQSRPVPEGRLKLLFAGRLERRKGADVLAAGLASLASEIEWELYVAGPVADDVRTAHHAFLENDRVVLLGTLSRSDLGRVMHESPIFVFPTYAEGSARAVFEALACGCYVITTPNAGSIVEDGVHGALIPPGDDAALTAAIAQADADRHRVARIGNENARLVAERYRQSDYGDRLASVYRELTISNREPG
jgi:glycosyltransferase involved in cell wall biosynthesis